jgi:outer membrane protein OmpA-like peptidoglycan-associated protein
MRTPNRWFLATLLLAGAGTAHADEHPVELGGFLGWHWFSSTNELGSTDPDNSRTPDDAMIFGLRLGTSVTHAISVEGELGLIPTESKADSRDDTLVIAWRANGLYHFDVGARTRLFALVGVGATSQATSDLGGLGADTDAVAHAGVGAKIHVRGDWGVRIDGRLLLPPTTDGGGVTTDWELTVGLSKVFRNEPDAAPATGSSPPAEPPPAEPVHEDTVAPPPDTDGDGLIDADDRCPTQPETANGFEDTDGCPDEIPAAVKQFTGAIEGIRFANDSDKLVGGSTRVLDQAVKALAEYPAVRLEIQGHTDDKGSREHNIDLSQRRAEAVRAYLVSKGVAENRVEAKGYGPDRPAVAGTTAAARAKNRRVEFVILTR